jgi:hypothetical protein
MTRFCPHLEILPAAQRRFWPRLKEVPRWFTLYGGTALALRLGHRASVDFDLFSSEYFEEKELIEGIAWTRQGQVTQRTENTLSLLMPEENDLRVSFFGGLTLGRVADPDLDENDTIAIASINDIAAMKLAVITQRAAERDYIDLAAILKSGVSLAYALGCAKAVYRNRFDPVLGLKALSYFGDLPELPKETAEFLQKAAADVRDVPEVQSVSPTITPDFYQKRSKK